MVSDQKIIKHKIIYIKQTPKYSLSNKSIVSLDIHILMFYTQKHFVVQFCSNITHFIFCII